MKIVRIGVAASVAVSLLTAVALTQAGGSTAAQPGATPDLSKYTGQQLKWGDCAFDPEVPAQCAQMTVPRDWAKPDAGIDLQVSISKAAATGKPADKLGVVLFNPGGPGGQGSSLATDIAKVEPTLNAAYDLVGMDPRGTGQEGADGAAGLGITCDIPVDRLPTEPLDARDRSPKSIREHQKTPRAIAEACQSQAVAPYITTWQTAHDMDLIRQLLGQEKLNYIGYSYGTWLGAKYASLFPERAGRIVLDSSVDFQGRLQADFEDFPRMGQRQADKVFLPWLSRQFPKEFGSTPAEVKRTIEAGRTKATALGLDPDAYDSLLIGNGSQVNWIVVVLVLGIIVQQPDNAQDLVADFPAALRAQAETVSRERFGVPLAKLTPKVLVQKRLGQGDAPEDYLQAPMTRMAVACGDQPTKSTLWYRALSDRQGPKYPYFGWQYGLGEVCGPWTELPKQHLPELPASVQKNVMVVQGEFDPQTSYEQAMSAVRKAPGVKVLRVDDNPFHGQYGGSNPCVDGVVNTYMLYGSTTPNAICPSVPLPGEKQVFPVRGPVDKYLEGHKTAIPRLVPLKPVDELLQQLLGDRISRVNKTLVTP